MKTESEKSVDTDEEEKNGKGVLFCSKADDYFTADSIDLQFKMGIR